MRFLRLLRHSAASGQIESTRGKTLSGDRVKVCPLIHLDGGDLGRRAVEMPSNSIAPPVSTGLTRAHPKASRRVWPLANWLPFIVAAVRPIDLVSRLGSGRNGGSSAAFD